MPFTKGTVSGFHTIAAALALFVSFGADAAGQVVSCEGPTNRHKAVAHDGTQAITTRFQLDTPNLQEVLQAEIQVSGSSPRCVVAHFSALARITDNYVVFQVRVDGVPMVGHLAGFAGVADAVVFTIIDDQDEQFTEPTKIVSYNFFMRVPPGRHTVEVMAAAGSNIAPGLEPSVSNPVLTLHYR